MNTVILNQHRCLRRPSHRCCCRPPHWCEHAETHWLRCPCLGCLSCPCLCLGQASFQQQLSQPALCTVH